MQQIYRRTFILKCDIEILLRHGCSPVNLLHSFRAPFTQNTSGGVLLESISLNSLYHYLGKALYIFENKVRGCSITTSRVGGGWVSAFFIMSRHGKQRGEGGGEWNFIKGLDVSYSKKNHKTFFCTAVMRSVFH